MSKPGETTDSAQQLYQAPESIQINTHTQQDELTETTTVSLQAVQYQMQQIPNDTSIQPPADFSAAPQNAVKNATERASWKDGVRNFFRPRQAEQQEVTEEHPEIQVQEQVQEQEQAQVQEQAQAQVQEQVQVQHRMHRTSWVISMYMVVQALPTEQTVQDLSSQYTLSMESLFLELHLHRQVREAV